MQLNPKITPQTPNNIEALAKCEITASHLTYQPHCDTLYTFYLDAPKGLERLYIPNLLLATPQDEVGDKQRWLCTTHYVSAETHIQQPERSIFETKVLQAFQHFDAEHHYHGYKHNHGQYTLVPNWGWTCGGWELYHD